MISFQTIPSAAKTEDPSTRMATRMVFAQNDRMAGSVPVRGAVGTDFAENLAEAQQGAEAGAENSSVAHASAEQDGFGFADIVDIINPLQHLPVVGYFYRSLTGDTMGTLAQIAGGTLFGGAVGGVISAGMAALQYASSASASGATSAADAYLSAQHIDPANRRDGFSPYNV